MLAPRGEKQFSGFVNCVVEAVGRPALEYARRGVEFYQSRLQPLGGCEIRWVKEGGKTGGREAGVLRVVLDGRGEEVTSRELAGKLGKWEERAVRRVVFRIGGAEGHREGVREGADWVWSLGRLTLQHELALLVVLEQLYRAQCIRRGHPYHRD